MSTCEAATFYDKEGVYRLLHEQSIPFSSMEHPAVYTMEDMEEYHITERGVVCKNLFLRDSKGKNHFLVTLPNEKQIDLKQLALQLGSSKLSFASGERLMKYLGVVQGCVSPLGILNDTSCSVIFAADEDLKNEPEVGIHPNDNTASIWISFSDLQRLIESHGNQVVFFKT